MVVAILSLQPEGQRITHSDGGSGSALVEDTQAHLRTKSIFRWQILYRNGTAGSEK